MTIALASRKRFDGARYRITGELSKNATWSQVLEFPADGSTVTLTALVITITFRDPDDEAETASISTTGGQITITDADTLTILATASALSGLDSGVYLVDIVSGTGPTHWASGKVNILDNPAI